jgi:hypothetical protein
MTGSVQSERISTGGRAAGQVLVGDLAALDELEAEAIGVFCWSDVRPLVGAAGYLDWRLSGALSRTLEKQLFDARRSEVMLLPAAGRLKVRRVFVFGLGPTSEAGGTALRHACRRAYDVMARAGVHRMVLAAPGARRRPELEQSFLSALAEELPGRIDVVLVDRHDGG